METRRARRNNSNQRRIIAVAAAMVLVVVLILVFRSIWTAEWEKREHEAMLERYPLHYQDMLQKYGGEYGLELPFLTAIMYCESSFNPNAVSSADARGLMQITPSTGEWIAEKLRESANFTPDILFDPETNIRYSCWYWAFLQERFSGDMVKMIAGYHAGQNKVDEWLEDPAISPDGVNLINIPPGETEKYVRRVQAVRDVYIDLYFQPEAAQ